MYWHILVCLMVCRLPEQFGSFINLCQKRMAELGALPNGLSGQIIAAPHGQQAHPAALSLPNKFPMPRAIIAVGRIFWTHSPAKDGRRPVSSSRKSGKEEPPAAVDNLLPGPSSRSLAIFSANNGHGMRG